MASYSNSIRRSIGVSRDVTSTFKKFRSKTSSKKQKSETRLSSFKANEKLLDSTEAIDKVMICVPPQWVDDFDSIKEDLKSLDDDLNILSKLSMSHIMNTFGKDMQDSSRKIKTQSANISKKIHEIDMSLKRFNYSDGPNEDKQVRKNVTNSLKVKLRDLTIKFKKVQESFSKRKPYEIEDKVYNLDDFDEGDKVVQSSNTTIFNEGIETLAKNMIDLSEIFKELNEFVVLQGTILDRIDYSLQSALENTEESVKHLKGAEKHQKCTRATGCIVILLVTIIALIITLGLKVYL